MNHTLEVTASTYAGIYAVVNATKIAVFTMSVSKYFAIFIESNRVAEEILSKTGQIFFATCMGNLNLIQNSSSSFPHCFDNFFGVN
jgi:hypothetical protein